LTEEEKAYNTELARRRVVIEHINAKVKDHRHSRWLEEAPLKGAFVRYYM
jgi:hypothetical protein